MQELRKKIQRKLAGVVVSAKMNKTVVVKVDRQVTHPKYHKKYLKSRNFKCHDEKGQYHPGDKVIFMECRPLSKDKRWRVIGKVK